MHKNEDLEGIKLPVFLVIGKYCYNWNLFSLLTITRFTNMKETNNQPKNPIKFSQPPKTSDSFACKSSQCQLPVLHPNRKHT